MARDKKDNEIQVGEEVVLWGVAKAVPTGGADVKVDTHFQSPGAGTPDGTEKRGIALDSRALEVVGMAYAPKGNSEARDKKDQPLRDGALVIARAVVLRAQPGDDGEIELEFKTPTPSKFSFLFPPRAVERAATAFPQPAPPPAPAPEAAPEAAAAAPPPDPPEPPAAA